MRIILQSKTHSNTSGTIKVIPPVAFNCSKIFLTSVSVPFTFYNIRSTNNTLSINSTNYSIDEQNYNSIQLASKLQSIIRQEVDNTVFVTFNKQKLKYIITTSTTFTIDFKTSRKLFGFVSGEHSVSSSTTSDFIGDINDGIHSLILTGNIADSYSTLFNDQFGNQIIARIPIEAKKPGDMINFSDPNNKRPIATNVKALQYFEIFLRDDDMQLLELNGSDYQIELFIEIEEKKLVDEVRDSSTKLIEEGGELRGEVDEVREKRELKEDKK